MSYSLVISEGAHKDVAAAYDYYENALPGLGERFLEALLERYADLSDHPQYYSYVQGDPLQILRDVKLKHFPYVVVFEMVETEVIIYAVHNTHRDPSVKREE